MGQVDLDTLGRFGVNRDLCDYLVDPSAWSDVVNVRCREDSIISLDGRQQVFGTLSQAPYSITPMRTASQTLWVWASLTDVFAYNGTSHTEITRMVGGDYSTVAAQDINSTILGGILIWNNGVDDPQFWADADPSTKLADLTNWPANYTAKVIRALGPFLVAGGITDSGASFPHRVLWSHPADPGSVPSSWDVTDATKDAGQNDLADVQAGVIQDMLVLRGQMFVYKDGSTWRIRFIGGQNVFAFDTFLDTSGILAPRCVGLVGDGVRHFVVTQDDVIVHNGNSVESVMDRKARRYLFNAVDISNYQTSFVFPNFFHKEMWFCYPTQGSTVPTMALIWNWQTGAVTEAEVDFVAASTGDVATSDTDTWDSDSDSWDSDVTAWSELNRRKVVVAKPSATKLLQLDTGTQFDGVDPTCRVQRSGLALIGRKRDRSPVVDFNSRKMITRVWPRLKGGPVDVRIGSQQILEGPVTWTARQSFDPSTDKYVDLVTEGVAVAIEFSSNAEVSWELEGYKAEVSVIAQEV